MDEQTREIIKKYFETGDRPTEEQFSQFIDSFINKIDDDITINPSNKNVGIGEKTPKSKLDVKGSIKISKDNYAPAAGTIRWTGSDFEGFDGSKWISLTKIDDVNKEISIPVPRIECKPDGIYAYWETCNDTRFKSYQPKFWLYRYKSRIKKTFKNKPGKSKVIPKKWAHPLNQQKNALHKNQRDTEFLIPENAFEKKKLNIVPEQWLRVNPNDKESYLIPKGQGVDPTPSIDKKYFNRRFEYFQLRIVINYNGKNYFGPFSDVFSLGCRRKYYHDAKTIKYKPVFELVQPGKGMYRK
ncbi:MAG: hypothetical protein WC223_05400 [Bacteroidales bacterium]|jgi:hypothetical protein